ncbi:MAG TPA: TlpA disulfide reductase family protein [Candidatus Wallbacteria bacterium]|nr:TlpA disulfide reductase family protein [Candidatus Wallbacteria bacterium]
MNGIFSKNLLLIALFVFFFFFPAANFPSAVAADQSGYSGPRNLPIGAYAPHISLVEAGKKQITDIDFNRGKKNERDKPTLILFWYLQCPNCVADIKHIKRLHDAYKKNITFITVNVDSEEQRAAALNFIKNNQMEEFRNLFEIIETVGENRYFTTADNYGVMETPSLFLISAEGVLKYKAESEIDFDDVEKNIKALIN